MENDTFDWGQLPAEWWLETSKQIGADERHAKFAAAKFRNCSNTEAARLSGFGTGGAESTRSEGYRVSRSNKVTQLLALAAAEAGGGYDGTLTKQEARSILTAMARGSDPQVRIKSIELLAKMEQAERELGTSSEDDAYSGDRFIRSLLLLPNGGTMAMLAQAGTALSRMCLFHDMRFKLQREEFGPTIWDRLYEKHSATMKEDIASAIADLGWQRETRVKLWNEIGMRPLGPMAIKEAVSD